MTVIIPNKDHRQDLDLCIRSMITRGTYKNLEFVVIENNSTDPETFAYYEAIQQEFPQVRVVTWTREFNYSAINNFGVQAAKGQYLLFLNNDTELIAENFVEEMLGFCQREDVGAVEQDSFTRMTPPACRGSYRLWWCGRTHLYRSSQGRKQLFPPGYVRPGLQCCHCSLHDEQEIGV